MKSEFKLADTHAQMRRCFVTMSTPCFSSAGGGEQGWPRAASSKEDAWEEFQELGGAAAEGAGALSADPPAAVPSGHAHWACLLPAFSSLCEWHGMFVTVIKWFCQRNNRPLCFSVPEGRCPSAESFHVTESDHHMVVAHTFEPTPNVFKYCLLILWNVCSMQHDVKV